MASKALLVVAALTALAWPAEVVAQGVKATVLSIGDGDTIRVRQAGKALTVRLACIDAPETAQTPYGLKSRQYLQQRLPEVGAFYWTVPAPDIVNPGREEQGSVSV
ncbi:MAG: thermonuclease family protein [Cyanobacteriota bacterium]|jgi:endonuclease YncB( thermonuclease family)